MSNLASDTLFIRNFSEGAGNVELPLMDVVVLSVRVVWAQSCSSWTPLYSIACGSLLKPPPPQPKKKKKIGWALNHILEDLLTIHMDCSTL